MDGCAKELKRLLKQYVALHEADLVTVHEGSFLLEEAQKALHEFSKHECFVSVDLNERDRVEARRRGYSYLVTLSNGLRFVAKISSVGEFMRTQYPHQTIITVEKL